MLLCACRYHFDDQLADATTVMCEPGAVVVENVITGEVVLAAADVSSAQPVSVPLDRSVMFTSVRQAEPSPQHGATLCELTANTVQCSRTLAGTDYAMSTGEIVVRYTIVTFSAGVTVQRGTMYVNDQTMATITPVPLASSFVVLTGGVGNTGAAWGTDEFGRARLVDDRTIEVRAIGGAQTFGWQVVTMAGAQVQRGERLMLPGQSQATVPIASVDLTRSFVLISHDADSTAGASTDWELATGELASSSFLQLSRTASDGPVDVSWEVITVPFEVTSGMTVIPTGTTLASEPLEVSDFAIAIASNQSLFGPATGGTAPIPSTAVNDMVGEGTVTLVPARQSLQLQRATSLAAAFMRWSVIDFGAPACSGS